MTSCIDALRWFGGVGPEGIRDHDNRGKSRLMISALSDEGWTSMREQFLFCMMASMADSTNAGRRSSRIFLSIR
jgi:hypothetical protein